MGVEPTRAVSTPRNGFEDRGPHREPTTPSSFDGGRIRLLNSRFSTIQQTTELYLTYPIDFVKKNLAEIF